MPQRNATLEIQPRVWTDLTEDEAFTRVLHGQSLLVLGIAGTGKTHYIKDLVARLRTNSKKVEIMSKTHTASERAGGVTCDHWVRRHVLHGACTADVVWIDEISQLGTDLWAQLNKLEGIQWLLSGDFSQFPALFDSWHGCDVPEESFRTSALLHRMAGGNRLRLTTCRRSDIALFAYYSSLIAGGSRFHQSIADVISEARRMFPDAPARHNLVISHRKRVAINRQVNNANAGQGAVFLKASPTRGQNNATQSMWIWPGLQLLGACSGVKKGLKNNCLYTVAAVSPESITLEGGLALTHVQALAWLRLSYARTYASIQGTEYSESIRLHDTSCPHFTHRHLFVAVSRAMTGAVISIAD
jgi:hypothetical protein